MFPPHWLMPQKSIPRSAAGSHWRSGAAAGGTRFRASAPFAADADGDPPGLSFAYRNTLATMSAIPQRRRGPISSPKTSHPMRKG